MHVVQLLLPLFDNEGHPFPDGTMREIRDELLDQFGGVTAFSRTPAEGVWSDNGETVQDQIILAEVMVERLDPQWWERFRTKWEVQLRQKSLVIRAFAVDRL